MRCLDLDDRGQLLDTLSERLASARSNGLSLHGAVGIGKTFLANASGHVEVRHCSVYAERAARMFKRRRGARLDGSHEDETRKPCRVDLLIIDDLAPHRFRCRWASPTVSGELPQDRYHSADRESDKAHIKPPTSRAGNVPA